MGKNTPLAKGLITRGVVPVWNKGLVGAQAAWNKGLKGVMKAWNKGTSAYWISGNKNPRWKGGITPENRRIRQSLEYRDWRSKVFSRDNFTCFGCGKHGGWLEAHHVKSFSRHPELRFDVDNGRTLCKPCHRLSNNFGKHAAATVEYSVP